MMEHIAEPDIEHLVANVKKHLAPGGFWIMSVSPRPEVVNGVSLHQTVQPKAWWIDKFAQLGLVHSEEYVSYFNTQFVRGAKYGTYDSFHLVLSQGKAGLPPFPTKDCSAGFTTAGSVRFPQRFLAGDF